MSVAFVSATFSAEHTTANTVYTAPSGIADTDLLIIWQFVFSTTTSPPTPTPPTGFVALPGTWPMTFTDSNTNAKYAQYAWQKFALSESGNYTVTHAACDAARGIMSCVSGSDQTTPFSPNPTQNTGDLTQTTTFLGVTTTVPNELILIFSSDDNDQGGVLTPPTGTTPTFTKQVDDNHGNFLASGTMASAAATGNKTMTNNSINGTNLSFFAMMAAIQPPAAAVAVRNPLIVPQGVNRAASF